MIAGASVARADPAKPEVQLGAYLQADAVPWSQQSVDEVDPSGKALNEERVFIRRAFVRAEVKRDAISGSLALEGTSIGVQTVRLSAVYARYSYPSRGLPLVAVTMGLFKTPFGAEVPTFDFDKLFMEPPAFARALFPGGFDGGAMVHGAYGVARWSVALMNGAPSGDAQWKGVDPASSFDVIGRLGADIEGPYRSRFVAGVSMLSGRSLHAGTPATKDTLQWVDDNEDGLVESSELTVIPGAAATPSQTFEHNAVGFDAEVHWCVCKLGPGMAFAEGVLATNLDRGLVYADPIAASRNLRQLGFSVGVVQELGDHALAGVRYDWYNADRDASEREGVMLVGVDKRFSTLGLMAAARWPSLPRTRFTAQYDHAQNPFGRGDNGMPATLADDRFTLRAQVGF